ncbi:MAG: choice-of-anchor X domain-containing protein [Bacteroidota bacterium]
MNKLLIFSAFVLFFSLSFSVNASAQLEIISPDNEFYVVAKYDFEANNPENFDTPYYWWAIYDPQTHQFLEKYFQRDISDEEALNNNKLENVVFLEGDKEYWIGVVYCYEPLEDPLALQELPDGCSFVIKEINVIGFELRGTIKGVASPNPDPIFGYNSVYWNVINANENEELFYTGGIYSFDLDKITEIQDMNINLGLYEVNIGLGKYIFGTVICNHYIEIEDENPLENFDSENCIILTRSFEVVENIHTEPLLFQAGNNILISGYLVESEYLHEFDQIKIRIERYEGVHLVEQIAEIELFDDGQHGDEDAEDGIYGNYWNSEGQKISKYRLIVDLYSDGYLVESYIQSSLFYIIASPKECLKIVDSGSVEDKLDIVIVGENFETVPDLLEVIYAQEKYFVGEYGIEPFKSNKEKINWYVSTYLLQDLCEDVSWSCNFDISNYLHCPYDKVIYFTTHNAWSYATYGGVWAVVSLPPQTYDNYYAKKTSTTVHEFGHSFGSLRDEYTMREPDIPEQPNCADSTNDAMDWWGDKVGEGKGVLQVLSADEISIIGTGPITFDEFVDKYGGWPDGNQEYKKCLLDLDDCINRDEFLRLIEWDPGHICTNCPTFPGCSLTSDNFRPTLLSTMRDSGEALGSLIDGGLQTFRDYYWWQNWFGPVNKAHLESLLEEYS